MNRKVSRDDPNTEKSAISSWFLNRDLLGRVTKKLQDNKIIILSIMISFVLVFFIFIMVRVEFYYNKKMMERKFSYKFKKFWGSIFSSIDNIIHLKYNFHTTESISILNWKKLTFEFKAFFGLENN
jgi:hypothetical protein